MSCIYLQASKSLLVASLLACLFVTACAERRAIQEVYEQPTPWASLSPAGATAATAIPPLATSLPATERPAVPTLHHAAIDANNIDKLALLNRFGGNRDLRLISYLDDGKTLAVVTTLGVYFYDAQTLTEIESLDARNNEIDLSYYQLAFNRQGEMIALGALQDVDVCTLDIWQFSEGQWQQVGQVEGDAECLGEALSPDGEYLASVNYTDRLVTVWRTSDLSQVGTFPIEYPGDIYSILVPLAFSGTGQLAFGEGNYVSVYALETGKLLHHLDEPAMSNLHGLAISQDGRVLAARDQPSSKIIVWNFANDTTFALDDTYEDWLTGGNIKLSPDGKVIAAVHHGGTASQPGGWIDLWQTSGGSPFATVKNSNWLTPPSLSSIAYSPEGSMLVTGGQEGIDFWQVSDGGYLHSVPGFEWVNGVLSPDTALLADSSRQHIELYSLDNGQLLHILEEGDDGAGAVVFSPDSSLLASLRIPGWIQLWDAARGEIRERLEYPCADTNTGRAIFSPDGQFLAIYVDSASCRGIAVWRVFDGQSLYEFPGSGGDSFSISPDGKILVVEDQNAGVISLVQIQDGAIIQTIQSPRVDEFGGLLSSFSPDGRLYAVGATNGAIDVWQIGGGALDYTLTHPFEWTALSFSPEGESLVTVSDAIQVWDARNGALRYTLQGQLPNVGKVLFSPDGTLLVTTEDGNIQLWNISDGTLRQTLEALPPVLFSPDGTMLVTSGQGMVQFWRVSDGKLLRTLAGSAIPVTFSQDGGYLIAMGQGIVETWGIPVP